MVRFYFNYQPSSSIHLQYLNYLKKIVISSCESSRTTISNGFWYGKGEMVERMSRMYL